MRTDVLRTVVLALILTACATVAQAAAVELISRADPPPDSNGTSGQPALSADGRYVAFLSDAPNLVPGQVDDNLFHDVFLHDRVTGTTTLVSHAAGSPKRAARPMGLYYLLDVQISADGRYVAFTSLGTDLVPGVIDTNGWTDVFLWDRVTDTTTLVSHAAGSPGVPANRLSYGVQLSADGNYLAFTSRASNLVDGQSEPGVNSFVDDAFLWERASNTVTLLSRQSGTTARVGNEISSAAGISADGGFVLYTSRASDLLPNVSDTVGSFDVFLYQRSSRTVSLVSRASGAPGTAAGAAGSVLFLGGDVVVPVLSDDGRWVAFASRAANLVPGQVDDGFSLDAFLFDRVSGEMRLVSRASASPAIAGGIVNAHDGLAISADGRYVAFVSKAANLVPGQVDDGQSEDVFVYDRVSGATALASHNRGAGRPSLSADGRFLAFTSGAAGTDNVFLYDQSTRSTVLVSRSRGLATTAANDTSTAPMISADGGVVAFVSAATDLGEGQIDPNRLYELFLYRRATAEITSPSRRDPGLPAATPHGPSTLGSLSADGRYAVFLSRAAGLVPGYADEPYGFNEFGDETGTWDAFLRDTVAGTTTLLTPPPVPPFATAESFAPAISADGRFTAFLSVQYGTSGSDTVYRLHLYDRVAGTLTLVNHAPGSDTQADGFPVSLTLSADGRYVAYECHGCGLVPGHTGPGPGNTRLPEVFLYDRLSGMNTLVSHPSGSPTAQADGTSLSPTISADGRFVVFASYATDLVPGQIDTPGTLDLFVFTRATGSIALVSHAAGTAGLAATAAGATSPTVALSADGRFIAFQSAATNLVAGQVDTNGQPDVFLHDRLASTTVLVSHAASSPVTAAGVDPAAFQFEDLLSISADGRFLVYDSAATGLVAGAADGNGVLDVFLYDRLTGANTLVSHAAGAPLSASSGESGDSQISADGSRIAFLSTAAGLTPGQPVPARSRNLYVRDRSAGTTVLAGRSSSASFLPDLPISLWPRLSADGRRIAFTSDTPFAVGDFNGDWDVYLWRETGGTPLPPCRLLDTRRRADRPVLTSNVPRTVTVRGACGVPATAKQVVVKVTVFNPSGKGNLRFYPGAVTAAPSGILRFERNATRTETFTLPLSTNGALTILPFVASRGTVHVAVEVTGYSQ